MKKLLLAVFGLMLILSACKKKDVEKTTAEKLVAKWKVTSFISNDYYNNANHITTLQGTASDYVDFRTDGKLYTKQGNSAEEVVAYSVVNDNALRIDNEDWTIKALSDNQFVLYQKSVTSTTPLVYDEVTLNLYK